MPEHGEKQPHNAKLALPLQSEKPGSRELTPLAVRQPQREKQLHAANLPLGRTPPKTVVRPPQEKTPTKHGAMPLEGRKAKKHGSGRAAVEGADVLSASVSSKVEAASNEICPQTNGAL